MWVVAREIVAILGLKKITKEIKVTYPITLKLNFLDVICEEMKAHLDTKFGIGDDFVAFEENRL